MNAPTKEQLDAVSNLLQACRLCGASYTENQITFPDGGVITVLDSATAWIFIKAKPRAFMYSKTCGKSASPQGIQIKLLQLHLKTLEYSSCGSPTLG
jgi:hypothetical protein